jgi:hypothetical protein
MLDNGIEILKQVEDSRYLRDGTRQAFIRIEFMVDKHGPFVERVDKDGFTAVTRDMKLNDFAREIRTS